MPRIELDLPSIIEVCKQLTVELFELTISAISVQLEDRLIPENQHVQVLSWPENTRPLYLIIVIVSITALAS